MTDNEITKRIQEKEINMLIQLDELFRRNKIRYYLACGTALGCVRHKGFIPWDDDVDIYFWGKDYSKIVNVFMTQNTGGLVLHDYQTVKGYPYTFPKVVASDTSLVEKGLNNQEYEGGLYIDLFPIFSISNNRILRCIKETIRYLRYARIRGYYYQYNKGFKKVVSKVLHMMIQPDRIQKKLRRTYFEFNPNMKYVIDAGVFWDHAILDTSFFMGRVNKTFEGCSLPLPKDFNGYLKKYYGEYMKLPPINERVSNHHFSRLEIEGEKIIK